MIKNDFRYIIKKIVIGIGIFIGIFYFKSCNVNALENQYYPIKEISYQEWLDNTYNTCASVGTTRLFVFNDIFYLLEYRSDGVYVNNVLLSNTIKNNESGINDFLCRGWNVYVENGTNSVIFIMAGFSGNTYSKSIAVLDATTNRPNSFPVILNRLAYNKAELIGGDILIFRPSVGDNISYHNLQYSQMTNNCQLSNTQEYNCISYTRNYWYGGSSISDIRTGFPTNSNSVNDYFYTSSFPSSISSSINSLNPTPILSEDNSILLGYNFRLNFNNFNTDNFVYKYKVGNSRTLILNSNNYELSIRNNDTLYVWVEDLEQNVVDNETFTISNVGNLYQGEYSIDFTYKDIAPSDTENTTGLSNIIDRVDINIIYLPKTNKLKYQYQYVNSDGSLNPQNWIQLNNNNSLNEYTFVAHSNGTLYARILDENDNVVSNNTFTVDSIGKLKLFNDNNNIGGFFDDIKKNINYTGPIYSLILMPINFLQTIYNGSNSVCQRYKIGTLFNHDIYFECVDLTDYIGSNLYNLLDVLSSSGVIYGIALFIKRKYNEFMNLNDNSNDIM